jgi:hypothetical protein
MLSFLHKTGNLRARKAHLTPGVTTIDSRVNYNSPFFVTPSSNYKTYNNLSRNGAITFSNGIGQIYNLKDYDYAVIQPKIGNPSVVLYVNDPDVYVSRNDTWFLV